MLQVGNDILDHRQMWQGIDFHISFDFLNGLDAGQRIATINIHRTGATNALTAGTAKGERCINFVLDLDDRVQHHWPTTVKVDLEGIYTGIEVIVGTPAINTEFLDIGGALGSREVFALSYS